MSVHTLPPVSYNPDEDWLRPIAGAFLVHLLVVLIFGLAWLWSPTRNTRAAAGEGTLEASLELSGAEMAAAQRALNQSIQQSGHAPLESLLPSRQTLPPVTIDPPPLPEPVPVMIPDTHEQMRALAEQQRQQEEEAERQRQAELLVEQQRQQAEAERQRQMELLAEQQRQQEEIERQQQQAALAAEQKRQQEEAEQLAQQQQAQAAEREQKLAELRQRRERIEQQVAQEQQQLERIRAEQQRANQAVAAASNAATAASSISHNNAGAAGSGSAGAGGDNNELLARYNAAIQQAVHRQWIRPESVRLGQTCRLTIHQIPGGQVVNVQFSSDCSYDQAGRDSVERAILRASPLPYRGFENVAERILRFNFEAQNR